MSKSFHRFHLTAAPLALALTTLPAGAQQPIVLDPVILSGGFSPVEAAAYGRAATVLTAEEMEQRGVTSVQDALRGLPGVSVSSSGASKTDVRIRGGESRHTLILIDGVNAGAGDQPYDLSGFDLADIERIEVLRGPQSVYYGSDATSGVINIITRKSDRSGGYARAEVGNGGALAFGHAVVADRWRLQADLGFREDRGYDHSVAGNGDKDGIRRATMGFSGEWSASDDLKLGFSSRRTEERYWYDGYLDADAWGDRDERINLLWSEFTALDGRLTHRLAWQDTVNKITTHDDNPSESKLRRRAWKYRATYGLDGAVSSAAQTLALSMERITDRVTGEVDRHWETDAVALEYRGAFDNSVDVQLGLRHDDNSRFGTNTNWN
ncbi:MAG TPA: TonB-dependent receptor, partial [Paracoccus sp.]|nr:TonB-dependent receptor [Paracoccus sp. (in: a-proteobacteria)]